MTGEQAIADFGGRFARNPNGPNRQTPKRGRIVMSRKRLVIADGSERLTIPLSKVVDLVVGNVPPHLRDLFDSTVTVGYRGDDGIVKTVVIESGEEPIAEFETVAFKCLLNGTKAKLKHPARVGGRGTNEPVLNAKLSIAPEHVTFRTDRGDVRIDTANVVGFKRTKRSLDGATRSTLLVKHAVDGQVSTTLIAPISRRRLNILGRFLGIRYSELVEKVDGIDLNEPQKRLLVAIYATDGDIDIGNVLNGDAARATNVLNALGRKGLILEDKNGISLTSIGQVIVSQRLDDVNV